MFVEQTGLHYVFRRYYDPGTGRFLTRDPFRNPADRNAYVYALNDPVNQIDPSGRFTMLPGCKSTNKRGYTPGYNGCGPGGADIGSRIVAEAFVPEGWQAGKEMGLNFTPACNTHDICYGTCCTDKDACDAQLEIDAKKICDKWLDKLYDTKSYNKFQKMMGSNSEKRFGFEGTGYTCVILPGAATRGYVGQTHLGIVFTEAWDKIPMPYYSWRWCDKLFCYNLAELYRLGVEKLADSAWGDGMDLACCDPEEPKRIYAQKQKGSKKTEQKTGE